jgi:hypothetical protein
MSMRSSSYIPLAVFLTLVLANTVIAQNEKKIAYGILIDNTGSLKSQFSEVKMLGKGLVKHVHQHGSISLFSFIRQSTKNDPLAVIKPGVEWSEDKSILDRYIDNLAVEAGQTTLKDAIYSIAENLNTKMALDKDGFTAKVIILVTDGEDRVSKVKEKELIQVLNESGIKVYALGLVQELERDGGFIRRNPKDKAVDFLKKITKETGGRVIFPKGQTNIDSLVRELLAG